MITVVRRVLIVLAGLIGMVLVFQNLLTRDAKPSLSPGERPTRPVTIKDLLEANVPVPTRSKVSFPKFTYQQAFPQAADEAEITVTTFAEAPSLRDHGLLPADWAEHLPDPAGLPPVEERLPINPAVVVGPDGVGTYGGAWRLCQSGFSDLRTKIGYESLTRNDPSGRLQPCLAYKWEVSPDNRAFTFYLRKGHRWSDGEPFTARDTAWVCNVNIGSPHWADPPDWMQATDGYLMLYEDDVRDWKALAAAVVKQAGAGGASVGRQIKALGGEPLWKDLEALADGTAGRNVPARAADRLNEVFRNRAFYTAEAFAPVDLTSELGDLRKPGASRLDAERMERMLRLEERAYQLDLFAKDPAALAKFRTDANYLQANQFNVLLFRSAYRDLVEPPRKQRVKVECVPDANGDDSHILRFTFRKPNSIFLEQTATFMFYRGLFNIPFHWVRNLHPDATRELALGDFWDWGGLFGTILAQANAEGPSPGKRLWEALAEPVRQKIQADPPKNDSPEAYKKELVAALNKVLAGRAFYDPAAWKGFDIEVWKNKPSEGKGWENLARDQAAMEEYRDWLVLEDLLKRWKQEGGDSLSDEETLRLNGTMFRTAFTNEDAKKPTVGRTRAIGLDLTAKAHPNKYAGWVQQMRDRDNFHPTHNPHVPVLQAWRIVSKKDDPEIIAVRNPYYYRVDAAGNQLPYIDAVRVYISTQKQIRLLKLTSGNVDFQTREISFDEFTRLKQKEKDGGYEVRLWADDSCGEVEIYTLQAHKDPVFVRLNEDPNFRYALSLALNRQEIIDVVYLGMGRPAQFSVPEGSPYYSERMARTAVEYDPNRANRLLDAMGLDRRNSDGTRLLWNGQPLIMDVNVTEPGPPPALVRLLCQYWQNIGINAQMKMRTSRMINRMLELGDFDIGAANAGMSFFGPMLPGAFYCSNPAESGQWQQWATYLRNGGRAGWPPPERIKELETLWQNLVTSATQEDKMAAWKVTTDRFAADLPLIGVMASPGKVVYVRNGFKNVPKIALAGWIAHEPGNVCPECFYFETK